MQPDDGGRGVPFRFHAVSDPGHISSSIGMRTRRLAVFVLLISSFNHIEVFTVTAAEYLIVAEL